MDKKTNTINKLDDTKLYYRQLEICKTLRCIDCEETTSTIEFIKSPVASD